MNGAEMIAAERRRQVEAEGWTPEHDDEHDDGALAIAAKSYLFAATIATSDDVVMKAVIIDRRQPIPGWPKGWDFKPSDDPIRNLVKAGALIAAEIDRIQRSESPTTDGGAA